MSHEDAVLSSTGGAILTAILANLAFGLPGAALGMIVGALGLPFLINALQQRERTAHRR
jgi:hypothetical protein